MSAIWIRIENNKLIETPVEQGDFYFEWDGVFFIHYGKKKLYTHKGVTYDCFPIVTINKDLELECVELFGCIDDGKYDDGYLFEIPMDYEEWSELKPFKNL